MATVEDLDKRLSKLEKESAFRFFVQYLLSPLLIVVFGTFMNWEIERLRSDVSRLDVAQKMVANLFTGNADQAFATERLMAKLVDPVLADEIHNIVANYYQNKIAVAVKNGRAEEARDIVQAARGAGGPAAERVVAALAASPEQNRAVSKVETAARNEREGFESLLRGDYDAAIQSFQAAEDAYPSYHQVYELARLLRQKKSTLADAEAQRRFFSLIAKDYSYGAPPDVLQRLKARSETASP
jgi:hypothetical protein